MRHGWQMCHLLVNHFGETGKIEARKLLERRSWQNNRLLGSFNVDVDNWVDFFTYTEFVDRDGKFQLNMLSTSGFAPLARSMGPMLREEGFHLGTGHMGLQRIVKAGRVPPALLQKYVNKWLSTAYDLFGKDSSSSAEWFYVWGLKGRYDEARQPARARQGAPERALARPLPPGGRRSCSSRSAGSCPPGAAPLVAPDLKFHRSIGEYAGETYSVTGEKLSAEAYAKHVAEVLPERGGEGLRPGPDEGAGLDRAADRDHARRERGVRAGAIRRALLAWFRREKRAAPLARAPRDPYRIWVSEVMLQQTTVAAVRAALRRVPRALPRPRLARPGPRASVLAAWSGLGYYARARNLHARGPRARRATHGGRLPARPGDAARRCRASASTWRPPWPRSPSARACPPSTPTSRACSRASSRSTASPARARTPARVRRRAAALLARRGARATSPPR